MKKIRKLEGKGGGLDAYLSSCENKNKNWEGFRNHDRGTSYKNLVTALGANQHGLCGYCEIDLKPEDRQIEHVVPRSDPKRGADLEFNLTNLIACCRGGTVKSKDETRRLDPVKRNMTCGQAKSDYSGRDFIDPRCMPPSPSLIRVDFEGKMSPDVDACTAHGISPQTIECTICLLGLNVERLRRARENRWNALSDSWQSDFGDSIRMSHGARIELLPSDDGQLKRFFSTSRAFFGTYAESVLSQPPQNWI